MKKVMKALVGLFIALSLTASVHAGLDIGFSSDNGGSWSYESTGEGAGTFSFTAAGVDNLPEVDVPVKLGDSVYVPSIHVDLNPDPIGVTNIYIGTITAESEPIKINKGSGDSNILTGWLSSGTIVVVGTTATLYPYINPDGDFKEANWYGSDGPELKDFSLTLQGEIEIAEMILSDPPVTPITGSTFSGTITVPEPATMFILALGSALLWKKK